MKDKIAEYKQVSTKTATAEILVNEYNDAGEVIGQHAEVTTEEVPVMGMVYRDMTEGETAEMERMSAEKLSAEPTDTDRLEAQVVYTALMTDTLLMGDDDDV